MQEMPWATVQVSRGTTCLRLSKADGAAVRTCALLHRLIYRLRCR